MHIRCVVFCCVIFYQVDANRNTENVPRWVRAAGYPMETHRVFSNDYRLTLHRLPQHTASAPVVMVVHGLFCSSIDWVFSGPGRALGYLLHNAGMDVWLPNLRGTPASSRHKTFNSNHWQFWNFTFEEQGVEDILSVTDYILQVTKLDKIQLISNSMGGTSLLIALSERPEYNNKFHQVVLFAPHTNMLHTTGLVRTLSMLELPLQRLTKMLQIVQFPPGSNGDAILAFNYALCSPQTDVQSNICVALHNLFLGNNAALNVPLFLESVRYYPTTTSMKTLFHIFQTVGKDRFARYDYGTADNLKVYGTPVPRSYDLGKVTVPVVLFHAKNDHLVPTKDIEWLKKQLSGAVKTIFIPRDDFGHTSFLWHPNVTELVYVPTVSLVSRFVNSDNKSKLKGAKFQLALIQV